MSSFEIRVVPGQPLAVLDQIAQVAVQTGPFDAEAVRQHLATRRNVLCCLAYVDGEPVGFKVGHEERPRYFESWIGGVAPAHRRQGMARALMQAQHQWCAENGYRIVSTVTEGSNHPMLIANLQAGFDVCGTFLDRGQILKVILQKRLAGPGAETGG